MSNYILYNGELYHHGIKGQKWGVRRYQKADGSLTTAGKKRYDVDTPTTRRTPAPAKSTKAKVQAANKKSMDIRDAIKAEVDSKKYKSAEERAKAADELYREKIREATKAGDKLLAAELQQQWAFSYDDGDWD